MAEPVEHDSSFLDIDLNNLELEWIGQPKLFHQWACKYADALRRQEECSNQLKLTFANLDQQIRESPEAFSIDKITEAVVKATVLVQEEYQLVLKKYNNATYKVNIIDAAVKALQDRRRALEGAVALHGQDYFSAPRENKGVKRSDLKRKTQGD